MKQLDDFTATVIAGYLGDNQEDFTDHCDNHGIDPTQACEIIAQLGED